METVADFLALSITALRFTVNVDFKSHYSTLVTELTSS